jgi:hypothetical protein
VFRWLGLNIDYDVKGLHSGAAVDVTPEGAFKNGKTVCSGYSGLYKTIGDELALEIICVSGYAKGAGYDPEVSFSKTNHEWNIIVIDSKKYFIDATWGSGSEVEGKYVRRYSPYYFGADPKDFIRSHFPEDPQYQLLDEPVDKEKFESLLKYNGQFYETGLLSSDKETTIISANETTTFTIKYNPNINMNMKIKLEYYQNDKYKVINNSSFMQKLDGHFLGTVALNKKGKYRATFFSKFMNEEIYWSCFQHIINCDVDAKIYRELPEEYAKYISVGTILYEPKFGPLKKGNSVYFKVEVRGVTKVMVETSKQVMLDKDGDMYTGNVMIDADKINVYYIASGMEMYSGLLKYNAN